MKNFGRVSVCGSISSYNANPKDLPKGILESSLPRHDMLIFLRIKFFNFHPVPMLQPAIVFKQLKIEGFHVSRWANIWKSGIERNLNLIKEVSYS